MSSVGARSVLAYSLNKREEASDSNWSVGWDKQTKATNLQTFIYTNTRNIYIDITNYHGKEYLMSL